MIKKYLIIPTIVLVSSTVVIKKETNLDNNNNESKSKSSTLTTSKTLSSLSNTGKLTTFTIPSSSLSTTTTATPSNEQKSDIIRRFHAMYLKSGGDNTNETKVINNNDNVNKDKISTAIDSNNNNDDNNNKENKNNEIDINSKDIINPIKNIKNRKIELIGINKSTDQRASQAIQLLVNDTLTLTALEGIKDSRDLAENIAKQLVLQVLTTPIYQEQFAEVLKYIFSYETVLSPTRWLAYWALGGKDCLSNTIYQSKWQLNYFFHDIEPLGAKQYTVNQINLGIKSWISNPLSRKNILIPNISWYLNQNIDIITKDIAKAIPKAEEKTIQGLSHLIVESLKSDIVRSAAREGLIYYFKLSSGNSEKDSSNIINK